jgi:predicted ATPase
MRASAAMVRRRQAENDETVTAGNGRLSFDRGRPDICALAMAVLVGISAPAIKKYNMHAFMHVRIYMQHKN